MNTKLERNVIPALFTTLTAALSVALFAATANADGSAIINGAGATFPYPIYSKWFSEYQKLDPATQINYQSIGSGGGIRQFSEKTVDFGATDAPMSDEELTKAGAPVLHIPTVLGAVAVTYNLPEAGSGLQLSGDVLADIFLGKIKDWNDPKVAAINPGKKLSKTPILVVRRSDGSGTTAVFTDYLAKSSAEWKSKVGAGKSINWPVGLGAKGNEGVAGQINQPSAIGSIGYVELVYAEQNKMPVALIRNKSGKFIAPSQKAVSAAAAVKQMPEDFRISITDSESKDAYPISAFTYLLVWKDMKGQAAKGEKLVKFLNWALKADGGQKLAEPLSYAPLPKDVAKKALQKVAEISLK